MHDALLTKLGLSPKAAAVYLACLQLGPSGMTEIAKAASLKRPSTYLVVDELLMRGFLSVSKKGKRTLYAPEHPRRFLQQLKTRERELEGMLPELEALYYEPRDKPRIRVFEGREAMMQMYEGVFRRLAEERGELLFYTAIGDLQENFPEALDRFFTLVRGHDEFHIRELNMGDARGIQYAKDAKRMAGKNHQIRLLDPKKFPFSETDNLIYGDTLMMFSIKRDIFAVEIGHKQIADAHRALFNAAWEAAAPM
ncbi:hypothetical protein EXS70_01495 [Candidatus Peribacteria bacterium]|nr:hypothetical protein [Candidatus Peribacteria bacterium]